MLSVSKGGHRGHHGDDLRGERLPHRRGNSPVRSILVGSAGSAAATGLAIAFVTMALEQVIKRIPLKTILGSVLGLFVGLGIGKLASYPFDKYLELPTLQIPLYIFFSAIFGYIGLVLGGKKMSEVSTPYFLDPTGKPASRVPQKILDTSVIIDGRIADIAETGFVEGTLIVPKFILEELQYIADSSDDMRRTRGRRGLDILKRLQQQNPLRVEFTEDDVPNAAGADSKLVALGLKMRAKILTNDFNLHKVAELQGRRGSQHQPVGQRHETRGAARGNPAGADPPGRQIPGPGSGVSRRRHHGGH